MKVVARLAMMLAVAAAQPLPTAAQRVEFGVRGAAVRVVPEGQGTGGVYTGVVGGGEGRLAAGPVRLEAWYVQGGLAVDGNGTSRDLVEGGIVLAARPAPWIELGVGPHVRSYVTPTGTERWVFWEGRMRAGVDAVPSVLRTYLEVAWVAAGSVTGVEGFGSGGGLEGGVVLRLRGTPGWTRAGYRVERATLGDVPGAETVERLTLSIGVGFW